MFNPAIGRPHQQRPEMEDEWMDGSCVTPTSKVCIRFGLMASFMSTVKAPLTPCEKRQHKAGARQAARNHCIMKELQTTDQVLSCDGLSTAAGGYDHLRQTLTHVLQAGGQRQHSHYFTGHCDVKLGLLDKDSKRRFAS